MTTECAGKFLHISNIVYGAISIPPDNTSKGDELYTVAEGGIGVVSKTSRVSSLENRPTQLQYSKVGPPSMQRSLAYQ